MPLKPHGTSAYVDEQGKAIATAEFQDFAPCVAVCFGCCVPEAQKKRTFLNAYDNKAMYNKVWAPLLCLTDDEKCMTDQVAVFFYDKPPFRTGMLLCIPLTCCGPPVIFSNTPKFLCIDCAPCFGSQVMVAPFNCFGLKAYLCCGNPCYTQCAYPLVGSLKNPDAFLEKLNAIVTTYHNKHAIPEGERAIFESVSGNILDFGGTKKIGAKTGGAPPAAIEMAR